MANPTSRTPEKDKIILDSLEEFGNYSRAARKARISRSTLYKWRADDPAFDEACITARDIGLNAELDDMEIKLIERAKKQDTTAAIFMLKSHRRDTYGDRVAHTGEDGGPLKIVIERVSREVSS